MRRVITTNVQPRPARGASGIPLRAFCAALMASTALVSLTPAGALAANLTVDGTTETISTPQNFDNVTVGVLQPFSQLDIVTGGSLAVGNFLSVSGDSGAEGVVTISGGGSVSVVNGVLIGNVDRGTLTVSGSGSTLSAGNFLNVGESGEGVLNVLNGAQASATSVSIGSDNGSGGTATVSGAGAKLTAGDLEIGEAVDGTLLIANGGVVEVAGTTTIAAFGTTGTLIIGAAAGDAAVAAGAIVGAGGGAATITFGAGTGAIVFNHTDTAFDFTANVSGNGDIRALAGTTNLSGTVDIGSGTIQADGGVLQIGGSTTAQNVSIGSTAGSTGTVTVSGSGSTLTADPGGIIVGSAGTGTLAVSAGGQVSSTNGVLIGDLIGAQGTVTVSGSGSKLTTSNFDVGLEGTGTLNVSSAGEAIASGVLRMGRYATGQGTVTVSGSGSKLTASSQIIVGDDGIGSITVSDGGEVVGNANLFIATFANSQGTVTISGNGSKLTASSDIIVGDSGIGTLTVSNGGEVVGNARLIIADNANSQGTVTVSGTGSKLTITGNIYLADASFATGTLTISDGGVVAGARLDIANSNDSQGTINVTGTGSKLALSDDLLIAFGGASGAVMVTSGGAVDVGDRLLVGVINSGTLTISGGGSKVTAGGNVYVGVSGGSTGTLTISHGGVLEAASPITIADSAGSTGTLVIGAAAGAPAVAAGSVQGAGGGAATIAFGAGTGAIVFNHTATNYSFNAIVSGAGTIDHEAGVTSLTGDFSAFSGTTNINGGTLSVDTTLGGTVYVRAGGTLAGTGVLGATQIDAGGTLSPGNAANPTGTLTIDAPLSFAAGASYAVRVSGISNSFTLVDSTAALGGATVKASFGTTGTVSLTQSYKILTATGGLTGTFNPVVTTNLANFSGSSLSYDANSVYLNLVFGYPAGLNGNQQAVADALLGTFKATGTVPLAWAALDAQGLSRAAGETATGSQQTAFEAMDRFINLMTDPGAGDRGDVVVADGSAPPLAYAGTGKPADAMAAITKAAYAKAPAAVFVPSWKVWAAGFGGSETTDGRAAVGSNNTTSSIYGVAAGADYRIAPDWTLGFALAGGGSNFKVSGSGDGRSDLFQAGGFVRHTIGSAYVSAALAYGYQTVTTKRAVGADQFQAKFDTNTISERIEGGWRLFSPIGGVGVTPYAAAQVTTVLLPAYAETAIGGSGAFALGYDAKNVTTTQSELGFRTDKSFALSGAVVTLRGRLAWAHDFNPNRSATATFLALPASSFVVNGAQPASEAALTSVSAEVAWTGGWSAGLTFDGRFSDVTRSYAGKGVIRRVW